jgi:hypothetical protein
VELNELKDYTVLSDRTPHAGTTVTLHPKPEIVMDEVFDQAQKQLLCSEIEIELTLDSESVVVPRSVPDVSDEDVLQAKQQWKAEFGNETFEWRGIAGETNLALSLAYRKTIERPTFLDQFGTPLLFGPSGGIRWPVVAICGFRGDGRGSARRGSGESELCACRRSKLRRGLGATAWSQLRWTTRGREQ